jgi:hypothetical protein
MHRIGDRLVFAATELESFRVDDFAACYRMERLTSGRASEVLRRCNPSRGAVSIARR